MHSSTILSTIFAAAAFAAPATVTARATNTKDLANTAQSMLDTKVAAGCNILKCLSALAPEYVTCAAALAEEGLNPLADAACFASALNNIANPPAGCAGC